MSIAEPFRSFSFVYGARTRRWCRRFRSIALLSSIVFIVANNLPFSGLIDEGIGVPILQLTVAGALFVLLPSASLYFVSLIILQVIVQRQGGVEEDNAEKIPRSFVYLRSFSLAKSSIVDRLAVLFDPRLSNMSPFAATAYKHHDPEEEIAHAIAASGLLTAIGDKKRSYGAVKIHTPDATWQSVFRDLAHRAEIIFVSPALTEGSRWELQELAGDKDYRGKLIFFMPRNWYADEWHDLQTRCRELFSFDLPDYNSHGAYFAHDELGRIRWIVSPEIFMKCLRSHPSRDVLDAPELRKHNIDI